MNPTILSTRIAIWLICFVGINLLSCKPGTSILPENSTQDPSSATTSSSIRLESLPSSLTGIEFANQINDEGRVNIFTWHFVYNGAGVAAGDINNDGLPDLYFTGNQVPDKLYLNKGDFHFEDITTQAGIVSQGWSSGVTMADINADGLLDIYVSKNSPTGIPDNNRNKLYINKGDNKFREDAAIYGLDDIGFSTQATFFDADQDGDLDMYQVNQPFDEFARLVNNPQVVAAYTVTDRFYFFENGKFVDKTSALGLEEEHYGLNVSLGDFDLNGWTDLYVCNDFHHGDRMLMNYNGTFTEKVKDHTGHTSFYAMGSDVGDINGDGWEDLFTLDMAYEDHYRSKTNMGSMNPDYFWSLVDQGQHYQYMQNVLQVNAGYGYFSDYAQMAGIAKSDWSFSTLLADLDLDADQDILITNGVFRDMRNNDFNKMVHDKYQNRVGPDNYLDVLHQLPSTPISNILYSNDGNLHFTKLAAEAGFSDPGFSNGMAYVDLNRDGRLDLVVNNENAKVSVYKNVTATDGHYLNIKLAGEGKNVNGLGCTVILYAGVQKQCNTMQTTRGYFSSVEPMLCFGLGAATEADSIRVIWNHKAQTVLTNVKADQTITIQFSKEKKNPFTPLAPAGPKADLVNVGNYMHHENAFNDYRDQVLIPYKLSQNGPFITTGDLNGDQLDDYFIGGAAGFTGAVYLQQQDGTFKSIPQPALVADKAAEDMESVLMDIDDDQDLDLIVISGSNEIQDVSPLLEPRLYINDGHGLFTKAGKNRIPQTKINGQCILSVDIDGDQDLDLFIGGRLVSGEYAVPASSYIWINQPGHFMDNTSSAASFLDHFGMVTDAVADDMDKDGDQDILVVGEWMAPTWLINDGSGLFTAKVIEEAGSGLWWTIEKGDFDKDGDSDFLLANLGWNNKFNGAKQTKLEVYSADFDQSGDYDVVLASTKKDQLLPVRGRECTSQEMPFVQEKFPTYEQYAKAQLNDIYSADMLNKSTHRKLATMTSLYIRNDGDGKYSTHDLPLLCQAGVVKAFYVDDFNGDQQLDFIFAGNHFPTEVETARYDGLFPGLCIGDGKGNFNCQSIFINNGLAVMDIRDIQQVTTSPKGKVLLFTQNNGPMLGIKLK